MWVHKHIEKSIRDRDRENEKEIAVPEPYYGKANRTVGSRSADDDFGQGFSFTVFPANGGMVVSRYNYDITTDRQSRQLYVLSDSDDIPEEIGKIVSIEMMRGR